MTTWPPSAAALAFVTAVEQVLPKAEASGDRLITALYLILVVHAPIAVDDAERGPHLTCAECRPAARELDQPYPCRTALRAYWALDAVLA